MKLVIIVPTRGRPHLLERLIESWKKTTSGHSTILAVLDEDDHANYMPMLDKYMYDRVEVAVVFGDREMLVGKLNMFSDGWEKEGYIGVGFMGDDCVFMTPGWELPIIQWLESNKGLCYGNDLLQGEALPNNVFIHVDVISALGFMAPPELKHYFIDNYWRELGVSIGKLHYFPEVVIEHRHWSNGKEGKDNIYTEAEKLMGEDRTAWDDYRLTGKMTEDVSKVLSL